MNKPKQHLDLKTLQKTFVDAIYNNNSALLKDVIATSKHDLDDLLHIYELNSFESYKKTLKDRYHHIETLTGEECFAYLCHHYIRQHPSTNGNMDLYGKHFPEFISTQDILADYPYLSDIARFDWLKHQSYLAKDGDIATIEDLGKYESAELPNLCITLHPSVQLFESPYPADDYIYACDQENEASINIEERPCYSIIHRFDFEVRHMVCQEQEFSFIKSMSNGKTLIEAFEVVGNNSLDVTKIMYNLLTNQMCSRLYKQQD